MSLEYLPLPAGGKGRPRGSGKWQTLVREFAESGQPAARILRDSDGAKPAASSVTHAIRSLGLSGVVRAAQRGRDVWVYRDDSGGAK